jgi:hypothetical protein
VRFSFSFYSRLVLFGWCVRALNFLVGTMPRGQIDKSVRAFLCTLAARRKRPRNEHHFIPLSHFAAIKFVIPLSYFLKNWIYRAAAR